MDTPIVDFVNNYARNNAVRAHMPGHKGAAFLGMESIDITEIAGADSLYESNGIIARSESNASMLYGSGYTAYSTEGSSQCIKAIIYMAYVNYRKKYVKSKPVIIAARNVHTAFISGVSYIDADVKWILPKDGNFNLCSCKISLEILEKMLGDMAVPPMCVYITSPDYLGNVCDIKAIAEICHKYDTILIVDNAHGAYFNFLDESIYSEYVHPLKCGADMCCDSAHKTLPVLTGGAYLHVSKDYMGLFYRDGDIELISHDVKYAMRFFGSTSPSYLILQSLDVCNSYVNAKYKIILNDTCNRITSLKEKLTKNGWSIEKSDPLKLTVKMPDETDGVVYANVLRNHGIECEYADCENIVLMFTPESGDEVYTKVENAFGLNNKEYKDNNIKMQIPRSLMSIRDAMLCPHKIITADEALGKICASPTVSCPPAIPIAIPGEEISEMNIDIMKKYNIKYIDCICD